MVCLSVALKMVQLVAQRIHLNVGIQTAKVSWDLEPPHPDLQVELAARGFQVQHKLLVGESHLAMHICSRRLLGELLALVPFRGAQKRRPLLQLAPDYSTQQPFCTLMKHSLASLIACRKKKHESSVDQRYFSDISALTQC